MRNRAREIEQEWRRLERKERWETLYVPVFLMIGGATALGLLAWYTTAGKVIVGLLGAIGLPLTMWFGRRQ